jgi:predicted PurR-regulated permease PerM
MERKNLLKSIVVMVLSLILIVAFANFALADDDFDWDQAAVVGNNVVDNGTGNNVINNVVNNVVSNNTMNSQISNNSNNSTNNTTTSNKNNVSSNSLAYTGSENTGIIVLIAVAGAIVTVYSFTKIKEYKNI